MFLPTLRFFMELFENQSVAKNSLFCDYQMKRNFVIYEEKLIQRKILTEVHKKKALIRLYFYLQCTVILVHLP